MKGKGFVTSSTCRQYVAPRTDAEKQTGIEKAKTQLWHALGIAALDPKDISDDWLRQGIVNAAEQRYGRRE